MFQRVFNKIKINIRGTPAAKKFEVTNQIDALRSYLDYYQSLKNPRYAVLVTGEWGSGKTYQVRGAIPSDQYYYVSLFGISSAADIEAAVYAQMHPWKSKAKSNLDATEKSALWGIPVGALGGLLSRHWLRQDIKPDKTIVFDDLERTTINPKELLGIINMYIEHYECRVIVIAHSKKLSNDLTEQSEKIFGQKIEIKSQIDDAYIAFVDHHDDCEDKKFLLIIKERLISIFEISEVGSLRIMRHVMEDLLRLKRCLSPHHIENHSFIKELVDQFVSLDFEVRAGRLTVDDIINRMNQNIAYRIRAGREDADQLQKPAIVSAIDRYKTSRLDNVIIPDRTIIDMLFNGLYYPVELRKIIDESIYFAAPSSIPAWNLFINFQNQDDTKSEEAMIQMNKQFDQRDVLEPGEILHIFALRMMQSANKLISVSIDEVFDQCRQYVDEIKNSGKIVPLPTTHESIDDFSTSNGYGGISYWVENAYRDEFEQLRLYLKDARYQKMLELLKESAPEILHLVENDGQKLFSELNHTAGGNAKYANVPVLVYVNHEQFVASWLRSHPRNWYWIQRAIEERFKFEDEKKTKIETEWVKKVCAKLSEEAANSTGIRRLRIQRFLPQIK